VPDRGEVDGYGLRRTWEQLEADVVSRGRRLRLRRRAARVLPAAAVVVLATTTLVVAALPDERHETVRAGPPRAVDRPAIDPLPALAFARFYDGGRGGSAIFVTDAGGTTRRLTRDPASHDGAPTWSPDGQWLAFDSQRDNPLLGKKTIIDVYLMRPDGTDVRRLTTTNQPGEGNGSQQPTWSPDGERLAVVTGDATGVARIVVIRADGTDPQPITDGPGDVFPAWSPDGKWIAFQRDDSEVWLVRPDGTDAHELATTDRPTRLSWTPDSTAVTFARGAQLVSVPVDGGEENVVAGARWSQAYDAGWLDGGALVAYTSDPDGLYLVSEEPDGTSSHIGGPEPATIVLAEPGGPVRRTLTHPARGDSDVNATFAPR
jgi:dipeptidyl aminopeptidase/acylaminoacyl peptidase